MSAPVFTGTVVVSVNQAAELNSLFMEWLEINRPELDAIARVRQLRSANWQSCPAEMFEDSRDALLAWLDR